MDIFRAANKARNPASPAAGGEQPHTPATRGPPQAHNSSPAAGSAQPHTPAAGGPSQPHSNPPVSPHPFSPAYPAASLPSPGHPAPPASPIPFPPTDPTAPHQPISDHSAPHFSFHPPRPANPATRQTYSGYSALGTALPGVATQVNRTTVSTQALSVSASVIAPILTAAAISAEFETVHAGGRSPDAIIEAKRIADTHGLPAVAFLCSNGCVANATSGDQLPLPIHQARNNLSQVIFQLIRTYAGLGASAPDIQKLATAIATLTGFGVALYVPLLGGIPADFRRGAPPPDAFSPQAGEAGTFTGPNANHSIQLATERLESLIAATWGVYARVALASDPLVGPQEGGSTDYGLLILARKLLRSAGVDSFIECFDRLFLTLGLEATNFRADVTSGSPALAAITRDFTHLSLELAVEQMRVGHLLASMTARGAATSSAPPAVRFGPAPPISHPPLQSAIAAAPSKRALKRAAAGSSAAVQPPRPNRTSLAPTVQQPANATVTTAQRTAANTAANTAAAAAFGRAVTLPPSLPHAATPTPSHPCTAISQAEIDTAIAAFPVVSVATACQALDRVLKIACVGPHCFPCCLITLTGKCSGGSSGCRRCANPRLGRFAVPLGTHPAIRAACTDPTVQGQILLGDA